MLHTLSVKIDVAALALLRFHIPYHFASHVTRRVRKKETACARCQKIQTDDAMALSRDNDSQSTGPKRMRF